MFINTKDRNIELFERGHFGNSIKMWNNIDLFLKEKSLPELICIRHKGKYGGKFCFYNIPKDEVLKKYEELINTGYKKEEIYFNDSTDKNPDIILQGELIELPGGLHLLYTRVKDKMRTALKKESNTLSGLAATQLLKSVMFETSYEDLLALLEMYPRHVVEFSVYSTTIGFASNRNVIFWEVRNF